MKVSNTILCPDCQSAKVKKNGKKSSGKQNFLCKNCGRQKEESLVSGANAITKQLKDCAIN
jgi:transposase-like protein